MRYFRAVVATGTENIARELLGSAGIKIGGDAAWDIQVHDARFYGRVLEGSLGLGESYVDGWWDCDQSYGYWVY